MQKTWTGTPEKILLKWNIWKRIIRKWPVWRRLTIPKVENNVKLWWLLHWWLQYKFSELFWKMTLYHLLKMKVIHIYNLIILLVSIAQQKNVHVGSKRHYNNFQYRFFFLSVANWKQSKCSLSLKWLHKFCCSYKMEFCVVMNEPQHIASW